MSPYETLGRGDGYGQRETMNRGAQRGAASWTRPRGAGVWPSARQDGTAARSRSTSWQDDVMRMKMRLLELGA